MVEIPLRSDLYRYTTSVDLDGVEVRLTLTWSDGCGAWYADVATADGVVVEAGARVSPGAPLLSVTSHDGMPGGVLAVMGPDPYQREALGSSVRLFYVPESEVPA